MKKELGMYLLLAIVLAVSNDQVFSHSLDLAPSDQDSTAAHCVSLQTLAKIAEHYARIIVKSEQLVTDVSKAKIVKSDSGKSYFIECTYVNNERKDAYLIMELASSTDRYPLLSYSLCDEPLEVILKERGNVASCWGQKNEPFRFSGMPSGENVVVPSTSPGGNADQAVSSSERTREIWFDLLRRIDNNVASDTTEFRLNDVPNYLWYLNCALTTMTMEIGYWDDHGYPNFVPGGSGSDGCFWSITEELCYISEFSSFSPVLFYAQAAEYGNSAQFGYTYFQRDSLWIRFVQLINEYKSPVTVTWQGMPYGAHSTLGIGYRVIDSLHFLILHDTWRGFPYYVSYDEYGTNIWAVGVSSPQVVSKAHSGEFEYSSHDRINSLGLLPVDVEFVPALDPEEMAYHCFESVDVNGDGHGDFVICSFRNNYPDRMMIYLYDNGKYTKDMAFSPSFESYECLNAARSCDCDKDGDRDIAVTGYWSALRVFINTGNAISSNPIVVDNQGRGFMDLDWGDFNNDGKEDLVASAVNGEIRLYQNGGSAFTKVRTLNLKSQNLKVRFLDMDKDGWLDLVMSKRDGTVSVFFNHGGTFNDKPEFSPLNGKGGLTFASGDIDNDGYLELISTDNGKLLWYENIQGVLDSIPRYFASGIECYAKDLSLTNLDSDVYPELIVANFNRPNYIFHNVNGAFSPEPIWHSQTVEPTVRVQIAPETGSGKKRITFCKSRGCNSEFFEIDTTLTISGIADNSFVDNFVLYANYPNPFNPSTTIRYGLPNRSHVTLTVFNTLGQQVATLENGEQESGYHEVKFDATTLSSGIYFCRMTAGSYVETRKLLLLR